MCSQMKNRWSIWARRQGYVSEKSQMWVKLFATTPHCSLKHKTENGVAWRHAHWLCAEYSHCKLDTINVTLKMESPFIDFLVFLLFCLGTVHMYIHTGTEKRQQRRKIFNPWNYNDKKSMNIQINMLDFYVEKLNSP